jgi:hypothetical protein
MNRPMKNTLARKEFKELVKVVVSSKVDRVVGFHMVGEGASEIMQVPGLHHIIVLCTILSGREHDFMFRSILSQD